MKILTTKNFRWYRLDSAAIIFPAIVSPKFTTMFRLSCDLVQDVDPALLQNALEQIMARFPYFQVYLRRGLFWYYFDTNPNIPIVKQDTHQPCAKLALKVRGVFPFRVTYYRQRIAIEFSHSITDGTGALVFLKSLAAKYLELNGVALKKAPGIFYTSDLPEIGEVEDAYRKYFKENLPIPVLHKRAFHVPYQKNKHNFYTVTTGVIPVKPLLEQARGHNVSLTVYLSAVMLEILQDMMIDLNEHRIVKRYNDIRILIPVNLRNLYPSKTLKNFSLFVAPGIDPRLGIYSFEDIIKAVDLFMKMEINERNILQQLSRNIKGANYIKYLPLFLKKPVFHLFYKLFGDSLYTSSISNLGKVDLPEDMAAYITRFEFYPPPNPTTGFNCSVISYNDRLYFSIGRTTREPEVEKRFFRKLVQRGFPVKIESNDMD